jgi:AraC family transcriptional regulator
MNYEIVELKSRLFLGKRLTMSITNDKTFELWHSFMPGLKDVKGRSGLELYSIIHYPEIYFGRFNPSLEFEKWAAVEVFTEDFCPNGYEFLSCPGGMYAQFKHIGSMEKFKASMVEIYSKIIPNSPYSLDNRPHITIMGERYNPQSEFSEEEILVPIK